MRGWWSRVVNNKRTVVGSSSSVPAASSSSSSSSRLGQDSLRARGQNERGGMQATAGKQGDRGGVRLVFSSASKQAGKQARKVDEQSPAHSTQHTAHSTAQHSTAQRTAQQSTAQHGTARAPGRKEGKKAGRQAGRRVGRQKAQKEQKQALASRNARLGWAAQWVGLRCLARTRASWIRTRTSRQVRCCQLTGLGSYYTSWAAPSQFQVVTDYRMYVVLSPPLTSRSYILAKGKPEARCGE